jgi:hypothetical protein
MSEDGGVTEMSKRTFFVDTARARGLGAAKMK